MGTFSYYGVYEPLIEHLAVAIYLFPYHLGSDDEDPTQAILGDRAEGKMYVGDYEEVEEFLHNQHPPQQPLTSEHWETIKSQVEAEVSNFTFAQAQRLGMFEMFGLISPEQQKEKIKLVNWLDRQIDNQLLQKYITASKSGEYRALFALQQFERRLY